MDRIRHYESRVDRLTLATGLLEGVPLQKLVRRIEILERAISRCYIIYSKTVKHK